MLFFILWLLFLFEGHLQFWVLIAQLTRIAFYNKCEGCEGLACLQVSI